MERAREGDVELTSEDKHLIDVVMGMFQELSTDLRAAREEAKRDHNAQVSQMQELDAKVTEALRRQDVHDKWHGKNDVAIAERLDGLATAKHDEVVSAAAVQKYKQRFNWIGNLGLDAVKTVALTGVGFALLGAGWLLKVAFS